MRTIFTPSLVVCLLASTPACKGGDGQDDELGEDTESSDTESSDTEATSESETTDTGPFDCEGQNDQSSCEDNPDCVWLDIVEIEIAPNDACLITTTDKGVCATAIGEDGCEENFGACGNPSLVGYYRELEPGKWELTYEESCYGPGLEWSWCTVEGEEFSTELPWCTCLCEL